MSDQVETVQRISVRCKEEKIEMEMEDAVVRTFTIREMKGIARDQYMTAMSKKARFDGEGKVTSIIDATGFQTELIARCLFDEDNKVVPVQAINNMSASAQNELFERCSKLNALDKEAAERSKKE